VSLLDVTVVALVALGAWLGWTRGFVRPLVSEVFAIGALVLVTTKGDALAGFLPPGTPRALISLVLLTVVGAFSARIGGVVLRHAYRVPFGRRVDRWLGLTTTTALAAVGVYLLIVALGGLDELLEPIHGKASVTAQDAAAVRTRLEAQPQAGLVVDPAGLERLQEDALSAPVPLERLGDYEPAAGFYETKARPQVLGSALGPAILSAGRGLPIVGREARYPGR
jgi:uncharacterized membrane protein required for colicin V production